MILERRNVVRFFAERIVPCATDPDYEGPEFVTQRKGFSNQPTAFLWIARGALFVARAERCYCNKLQREYKGSPAWDGGPEQCRYCDRAKWDPVVERLARILRTRCGVDRKTKR